MEEEGSFFLGQMQQIKCVQIMPTNVQCKQIMAIFLLNAHTDTHVSDVLFIFSKSEQWSCVVTIFAVYKV